MLRVTRDVVCCSAGACEAMLSVGSCAEDKANMTYSFSRRVNYHANWRRSAWVKATRVISECTNTSNRLTTGILFLLMSLATNLGAEIRFRFSSWWPVFWWSLSIMGTACKPHMTLFWVIRMRRLAFANISLYMYLLVQRDGAPASYQYLIRASYLSQHVRIFNIAFKWFLFLSWSQRFLLFCPVGLAPCPFPQ